jgi:hypothetical protein
MLNVDSQYLRIWMTILRTRVNNELVARVTWQLLLLVWAASPPRLANAYFRWLPKQDGRNPQDPDSLQRCLSIGTLPLTFAALPQSLCPCFVLLFPSRRPKWLQSQVP